MPHPQYTNSESLKSVIKFYRGDWWDIFYILVYGLAAGIFTLVVPLAAQSLVNTIAFSALIQPLIVLTVAVFVFLSIGGVFKIIQFYLAEVLAQRLMVRVGLDLAKWIPELKYDIFKSNFGSEYINRFLEIAIVQKATSFLLLEGSGVIFQLFFAVLFLGFYHPFFLIFSLAVSLTLIAVIFIFGRAAIPTSIIESDNKYRILSCIEDIAAAPQLFKSSIGQNAAIKKMDYLIYDYLVARRRHFRVLISQQVSVVGLHIVGSAALLGIGGYLVIKEELSIGQLVAAELIFTVILSNIDKLTKFLETFYDLAAGINKLELLALLPKEEVHSGELVARTEVPLKIELKSVTFLQKNGDPLFEELNLLVKPGEKVVIFGANGVGKSVLADLMIGFKQPERGQVLFDDSSLQDISLNSLRSEVALVRGVEIIHGTIEENLKLYNPNLTSREIRDVLANVDLLDDIDSLPEGTKTYFKGHYAPFSIGQAERLMVARAILQKPRLLILDATLDIIDERSVFNTIQLLLSDKLKTTVIALTHERQFMDFFDSAYQLNEGKLEKVK